MDICFIKNIIFSYSATNFAQCNKCGNKYKVSACNHKWVHVYWHHGHRKCGYWLLVLVFGCAVQNWRLSSSYLRVQAVERGGWVWGQDAWWGQGWRTLRALVKMSLEYTQWLFCMFWLAEKSKHGSHGELQSEASLFNCHTNSALDPCHCLWNSTNWVGYFIHKNELFQVLHYSGLASRSWGAARPECSDHTGLTKHILWLCVHLPEQI